MNDVPTILVGLGGIGSRTVDTIYGWLPKDKRGHVAIHAFDTNVNDIQKLTNLKNDGAATQTSTQWTVGEYLKNTDESVKDWFPDEHTEVLRKSLTDGAGQIRSVSRLAYRAAMQEGKLDGLHNSISHIFKETGKDTTSSARVMIVTSLVGGTGAGIFLQTAMYLRELLETEFKRKNVLIRGAFMLPDILVLTNAITGDEVNNIRANAYACIKELNAITKNASINNPDDADVAIELEYKPNQMDSQGRLKHVVTTNNLPYNFMFMFDFENTEKNNLMYLTNYFKQVARTTYLDLFSPISDDRFSKQDNQILSIVGKNGLNRYCGAGVASLVYPYDDLVKYCGLRWASDSLNNQWLKIDEEFANTYKQYENDIRNGVPREEPKIGEQYRKILDNLANDERPRPFYKSIYRKIHIKGEKDELGEAKAILFADAVDSEIDRIIDNDDKLQDLMRMCAIDENRLKDKDRARNEINNMEEALYDYEKYVKKFVQDTKIYLSNQIMLADFDHGKYMEGQQYRLNTWMLGEPEPVHPVGVRYIMYQIQELMEQGIMRLETANKQLETNIKKYETAFDLPDTEDYAESADDRLREASKQNMFGKLLNSKFKEFTEEYTDKSYKHVNNLNKYRKDMLKEMVYEEILKAIKEMNASFERYFKNLLETRKSLINELDLVTKKHDGEADPSTKYVLAGSEIKEKLWENIRTAYARDELPAEISQQIYSGQYERFAKERKGQYITEQKAEKVEEMFRKDVLEYCEKELYKEDALDINCVRALRKEAEYMAIDENEISKYISKHVSVLDNLARPLVPPAIDSQEINSWGVHPECIKEMAGGQKEELFDGSDLVEDEAFSRYEVIRNRTQYNMTIEDFPKFYSGSEDGSGSGVYYDSYNQRIKDLMESGNTVTPHLDKRWHLPAYLPELNSERAQADQTKANRALILGTMMGYLENTDNFGKKTWLFSEDNGSRLVYHSGDTPANEYTHDLKEALLHNPIIIDKVINNFNKDMENDRRNNKDAITAHKFYANASQISYFPVDGKTNIFDLIIRHPEGDPGNGKLVEDSHELLKVFVHEVDDYFTQVFGIHRKAEAKQAAIEFIDGLMQSSAMYKQTAETNMQHKTWTNIVDSYRKG